MKSSVRSAMFRLLILDADSNPGIPLAEFWEIFTVCQCGLVTTRRAFPIHNKDCIVDLTDMEEDLSSDHPVDESVDESGNETDDEEMLEIGRAHV